MSGVDKTGGREGDHVDVSENDGHASIETKDPHRSERCNATCSQITSAFQANYLSKCKKRMSHELYPVAVSILECLWFTYAKSEGVCDGSDRYRDGRVFHCQSHSFLDVQIDARVTPGRHHNEHVVNSDA